VNTIKIWYVYDINGSTLIEENENGFTDLEFSFATTVDGMDPKEVHELLKYKGAKEDLLKLFDKHGQQLCRSEVALDFSDQNESIFISQEILDWYE
jgi:hypothetical protein